MEGLLYNLFVFSEGPPNRVSGVQVDHRRNRSLPHNQSHLGIQVGVLPDTVGI